MRGSITFGRSFRLLLGFTAGVAGCAETFDEPCEGGTCDAFDGLPSDVMDRPADEAAPPIRCGDGICSPPGESAASCPADCGRCAALADVTTLIGASELFFGYSTLGTDDVALGCGSFDGAHEVRVGFTPEFDGEVVLSTRHPSTRIDTVLEVREAACEGVALGCNEEAVTGTPGSRLTIPVRPGTRYVALVETADDETGVFALGLHRPGVCEGLGTTADITSALLTGGRFAADTGASTSSLRGSCAAAEDNPEVRFTFTAPRTGTLVATTAHPDTAFDTLLHVRAGPLGGSSFCDSPETEIACGVGGAPADLGTLVRFDVESGRACDLFVDGAGAGAQGVATLTLGYAATSPARAALQGCDHDAIQDQFAFLVQGGQSVHVKVDTVDAATAADTRLRVRLPDGTELYEADDDVACTYPPPSYSCPDYTFAAATAGLYTVEVYVGSTESCRDRSLANYELTVTVAGEAGELILIKDQ